MSEVFEDKQQRCIRFSELETALEAHADGVRVGRLEVALVELPPQPGKSATGYVLTDIFVAETFRRAGLGYELLAAAMSCFYPLRVPETGSDAYQALLATAKRKGLLLKTWPQEHDTVSKLRRGRGRIDW